LVKPWHENEAEWGFNEWCKAQTGKPAGRDWQTWSAASYLYAACCVERGCTPFFDEIRAVSLAGGQPSYPNQELDADDEERAPDAQFSLPDPR
jgi:hypothetical protein